MSVKSILRKSEISNLGYINLILEASASSCQYGDIMLYEGNKKHPIRSSIHSLLLMPFGAGKTSSLVQLGKKHTVFCNEFTSPAILGTITKDGKFVKGFVSEAGGKILVIDEIQNLQDSARKGTLSLLEHPYEYTRSLGYKATESRKFPFNKFCWTEVKENQITIRSKFSCIASGMYIKTTNNPIDLAWLSRFVPMKMSITWNYVKQLTRGEKSLKINPKPKNVSFKFKDYFKFHDEYCKKAESVPFFNYFQQYDRLGFLSRNIGDMARLSCFFANVLDKRTSPTKEHWELALRFLPISLYNYMTVWLTDTDYYIVENYGKMSQKEMSEKTNTTPSNVSQRIQELKKRGLLPEGELSAYGGG